MSKGIGSAALVPSSSICMSGIWVAACVHTIFCIVETRKFEKRPLIGMEGVYDENSDYRGKKTNRMEKNIKYIDYYSVKFHRTADGSMPFCSQEAHALVAPAPPTTPSP
jgi:hypothetical protein